MSLPELDKDTINEIHPRKRYKITIINNPRYSKVLQNEGIERNFINRKVYHINQIENIKTLGIYICTNKQYYRHYIGTLKGTATDIPCGFYTKRQIRNMNLFIILFCNDDKITITAQKFIINKSKKEINLYTLSPTLMINWSGYDSSCLLSWSDIYTREDIKKLFEISD